MSAYVRTTTWVVCVVFCSSCCTPVLWEATDPAEHVAISADRVSEQDLKARRLRYYKDETRGLFTVEKSSAHKLGDYTIRALATPVTVTVDAATTVLVVGGLVFASMYFDEPHYQYMTSDKERAKEPALLDKRQEREATP